jgi:anthranilate/para-aminobenzoate synthase component I
MQAVFTVYSRRFARVINYFNLGAGIVADSIAAAEYEETPAKAAGFLAALNQSRMDMDEYGLPAVKSSG